MPVHDEKVGDRGRDEADQYVPVLYAHSVEEAERYCQLLEDHDIPAIVDDDYEDLEGERLVMDSDEFDLRLYYDVGS